MRILVTGALGKVGAATVAMLHAAGHEVTGCDLRAPAFERSADERVAYLQADLTDAGDAFAAVRGHDAVVHAAALPDPAHNPPATVFHNNLMGVFNTLEAAVRFGVGRFVNVSSETVPGFFFPERPDQPDYLPIDEEHPIRPQDPYGTAKYFGELLCDAAVRRSDIRCLSIRPTWVQWEGNYARNLGPAIRDPASAESASGFSYIDVYDLADALELAATSDLPGHEVVYISSPDNFAGRPLRELVGDDVELRELEREDAGGTSIAKARRVLGYAPRRAWRDYLDERGELRPEAAERLERADTGVQRGRMLLG
jgi:nucleoside-diphosphate-sugar epimerase